jgi:hypothetical protein
MSEHSDHFANKNVGIVAGVIGLAVLAIGLVGVLVTLAN